jgi:membrane associated rhomboid family serine protease
MVTITAIALCVVMYVAQMASSGRVLQEFAFVPGWARYQPYRLITGAFLHGGVAHLLINMYSLWVVGSFVEQLIGRWRMAALYVASAVAGNMAVLAWARLASPESGYFATVGASGAVFGLFAAVLVLSKRLGGDLTGIASVIGFNLVFSFLVAQISWQAHVGGLIMGGVMAAIYAYAPRDKRLAWAWGAGAGAAALLAVLFFALTA